MRASISPRASASSPSLFYICFLMFLVLVGCSVIATNLSWQKTVSSYLTEAISVAPKEIQIQIQTVRPAKQNDNTMSIPPSEMKVHYHEMWNHNTSMINIPDEYKNPFNVSVVDENGNRRRPPLTSLKILENVLHGSKYRAEFEAVEVYVENINSPTVSIPKCLAPDLGATRELVNRVVEARNKRNNRNSKRLMSAEQWPYEQLVLPLPVLNVGYPKLGSNTLQNYLNCIGLRANHGQNGKQMFENLSNGKQLYSKSEKKHAYTQLDNNFQTGFYPQISLLDELHELNPNSTFVFNFRPMADWIRSVTGWKAMRGRFARFLMPGLVMTPDQLQRNIDVLAGRRRKPIRLSDVQLAKWWCGHVLHLREYVKEYPGHALIELDLYDSNGTASVLYDLFQADTDAYHHASSGDTSGGETQEAPNHPLCWGQSNQSTKKKAKK